MRATATRATATATATATRASTRALRRGALRRARAATTARRFDASRRAASTSNDGDGSDDADASDATPTRAKRDKPLPGSGVNLYDPVATASRFLTRRFGIVGGLGLVALLASVEGGEIVKALLERDVDVSTTAEEFAVEGNAKGLRARDVKIGGGASAKRGDFVGVNLTVVDAEDGVEYLNTKKAKRPIAFTYEKKPLLAPICEAIEDGVRTMKRGGVRRVFAPSAAAFGERGVVLTDGTRIKPNRDLIIDIVLEEVSPSYV